jgi:2-hydroxychromene-2-carboxylate isomerase
VSPLTQGSKRQRSKARPRFYFSFRSPYSWLAYHDLMSGHRELASGLEWRPFWEPDDRSARMLTADGHRFPYVEMSRAKHLYVLQDVDRLRRARGLAITWPVDRNPVWEVPHLAYLAACDAGQGPRFIEAIYAARWQRGLDICAPATIAEVAGELGLDAGRLAGAAGDDSLRERGLAALVDVVDDGAFGVPFFVHGFAKFWGVDRLPAFLDSVGAGGASPRAAAAVADPVSAADPAGPGGDQGHAGGCG